MPFLYLHICLSERLRQLSIGIALADTGGVIIVVAITCALRSTDASNDGQFTRHSPLEIGRPLSETLRGGPPQADAQVDAEGNHQENGNDGQVEQPVETARHLNALSVVVTAEEVPPTAARLLRGAGHVRVPVLALGVSLAAEEGAGDVAVARPSLKAVISFAVALVLLAHRLIVLGAVLVGAALIRIKGAIWVEVYKVFLLRLILFKLAVVLCC